jgi:hypothetical protein
LPLTQQPCGTTQTPDSGMGCPGTARAPVVAGAPDPRSGFVRLYVQGKRTATDIAAHAVHEPAPVPNMFDGSDLDHQQGRTGRLSPKND